MEPTIHLKKRTKFKLLPLLVDVESFFRKEKVMLEQVKEWFEKTEDVHTNKGDWGVESTHLLKEELDEALLPKGLKQKIAQEVQVTYYYCQLPDEYYVVYAIPLLAKKKVQLGLLNENRLIADTVLIKHEGDE